MTRMCALAVFACACTTSAPTIAPADPPPIVDEGTVGSVSYALMLASTWKLDERICFAGPRVRIMPAVRAALPFLERAVDNRGAALPIDDNGVDVRALAPHDGDTRCATLTIDLARAARSLDDDDLMREAGGVLLGSPDVWLWRPEPWPESLVATLTFQAPDGVDASLPFERDASGAYLVPRATWRLMSKGAFGRLDTVRVTAAHAELRISRLGPLKTSRADVAAWLSTSAEAVGTVLGRFPQPHVQVLLVPIPSPRAVPFGMAMRGGGPTVLLLVANDAKKDELMGEWVVVHELSHLLLPPFTDEGTWFAEGSASYFQQILRSRVGLISERDAWNGLASGFARGREQAGDTALADAARTMHRTRAYQQVYWGGAAILLLLDVELRARGSSLDAAVAAVRAHEQRDVRQRDVDEVLAWMAPASAGLDVRAFVSERLRAPFPDTAPALAALGVLEHPSGVTLSEDAPLAATRRAIAARRAD